MENKCPKCNFTLDGHPNFCPNCGEKLTWEEPKEKEIKTTKKKSSKKVETKPEEVVVEAPVKEVELEEKVEEAAPIEETVPVEEPKPAIPSPEDEAKKNKKKTAISIIYNLLGILTHSLTMLISILYLTLPMFYAWMIYDGDGKSYAIKFGYIDYAVKKIIDLITNFEILDLTSAIINLSIVFMIAIVWIAGLTELIKSIVYLFKKQVKGAHTVPSFLGFGKQPDGGAFVVTKMLVVLPLASYLFGWILGDYFNGITWWLFIPVACLIIPIFILTLIRLILGKVYKK